MKIKTKILNAFKRLKTKMFLWSGGYHCDICHKKHLHFKHPVFKGIVYNNDGNKRDMFMNCQVGPLILCPDCLLEWYVKYFDIEKNVGIKTCSFTGVTSRVIDRCYSKWNTPDIGFTNPHDESVYPVASLEAITQCIRSGTMTSRYAEMKFIPELITNEDGYNVAEQTYDEWKELNCKN